MPKPHNPPLENILIRVFNTQGVPIGAGVLIDDEHGMTCAHVINAALDRAHQTQAQPRQCVSIDFPLLRPDERIEAEVVFWRPISVNSGDIAGFRLKQPKPDAAEPARMVQQPELWELDFRTQGFPQGHAQGLISTGRILDKRADGYVQLEAAGEYKILPGFSGAPVWSQKAQGVLGIMVVAESNRNIKAGWMIPTSLLARAWDRVPHHEQLPCPSEQVLPTVGAAIAPASPFYIERESDDLAVNLIEQQGGITLTVVGPSKIGKSSLLARLAERAKAAGKRVAYINFRSDFNDEDLQDVGKFYRRFFALISDLLDFEDLTDDTNIWKPRRSNNRNGYCYVTEQILANIDAPLLLAMDDVNRIYGAAFSSDFFGMLRSWHDRRAITRELARLDMVLVLSTEPHALITELTQSPFNVTPPIHLRDFDLDQVRRLNTLHGDCLTQGELERLHQLLQGHPYLTRVALYNVATEQQSAAELFANALRTDDEGPFAPHLRHYERAIENDASLKQGILQVMKQCTRPTADIHYRLQWLGLIHETAQGAELRNCLYSDFFTQRFRP